MCSVAFLWGSCYLAALDVEYKPIEETKTRIDRVGSQGASKVGVYSLRLLTNLGRRGVKDFTIWYHLTLNSVHLGWL